MYEWADPTRREIYAEDSAARRELIVFIWYPAVPAPDAQPCAYVPGSGWEALGRFWGYDPAGIVTHCVADAPVAPDQPRYPVLVAATNGFAPFDYTALMEELASHGYVVAGIHHPYFAPVTAFADGRTVEPSPVWARSQMGPFTGPFADTLRERAAIVEYEAADIASVVNTLERMTETPLAGRLDLGRLGTWGHSLGGVAALEYCRTDGRCRATVNLDGGIWSETRITGIAKPALLIAGEHPEWQLSGEEMVRMGAITNAAHFDAEKAVVLNGWRTVYTRARTSHALTVRGARHAGFLDAQFLPLRDGTPLKVMLGQASIDPGRMWRITSDYLLTFFGRHLDGRPAPLLDHPPAAYPEVTFGIPEP
jgi:hypothetical protein